MATNFGRVCGLKIGLDGEELDVSAMRIRFEVEKSSVGYPNIARIFVYNLSEATRAKISEEFQSVELTAGFEDSSGLIFKGEIENIFHRREQPNWVTEIYAKDGLTKFKESKTNESYGKNVQLAQIIAGIKADMGIDIGEINIDLTPRKINGWTFTGRSVNALNQLAKDYDFNWGIQTNRLNICSNDETIIAATQTISSQTGMVESPTVTESGVNLKVMLRWDMIPNQHIKVVSDSKFIKFQNIPFTPNILDRVGYGDYIGRKIMHSGDTRSKDWYTDIEGYYIP